MNIDKKNEPELLIHFAGFTLDLQRRGLYRGQQRIHLTSKPLETLIYLAENRGRVVEKHDLLNAVWKDTFVTEDNLVHAIREIRRALGDKKDNPSFVQTVPRQGYRFVCEVSAEGTSLPGQAGVVSAQSPSRAGSGWRIPRWLWIAAPVVAIIAILALLLRVYDISDEKDSGSRGGRINKQITTGEFSCNKPAFSRDGKLILYVSSSEGTRGYGDLFIRQFPEGTALRITNRINPSGDLPVFTADGNHVVFSIPRVDQNGVRHHDLWKVPSLGGPPERFIEDSSGADFSPDGEWVAYTRHQSSEHGLCLSPVSAPDERVVVSAQSYTPRWSPSGEWLAYTTSDPNGADGDIWVCSVSRSTDGRAIISNQKQLTRDNKQIYGLTWTADNRSIIFASKRTGSAQLYLVSIANGSISPLLVGVGEYEAPSASPDGRTVMFHNKRLVNDLMMSTPDGISEAKHMTYGEFHRWSRISPSGDKLASVLREVDNSERLYITDLKTMEGSHLTERAAHHPCWIDKESVGFLSPDASKKNTEVLVVNTHTRETKTLTLFSGEANWLAIHPDRQRVAVVVKSPDGKESIVLRDLSSQGNATIHEGAEYEDLRWSPDGSALCWSKPGVSRNAPLVSGGIWLIEMGKTEPRLIAHDGYCPVWSGDGTSIYFTIREGRQGLWRYDLRQKKEHLIRSWEAVYYYDIVGSRLVFAQLKNDSQIYAISLNQ